MTFSKYANTAAHHCVLNHPANMIMQNFVLPLQHQGGEKEVPSILGLTASPVLKSKVEELKYVN